MGLAEDVLLIVLLFRCVEQSDGQFCEADVSPGIESFTLSKDFEL